MEYLPAKPRIAGYVLLTEQLSNSLSLSALHPSIDLKSEIRKFSVFPVDIMAYL